MTDLPLLKLKITICGDINSVRILTNHFNPNLRDYTKFMGFSNATKLVRVENFNAKFIIWIIERLRIYESSNFFSGSLACIILFNLTSRRSFDGISNYRLRFRGVPIFLVGNKADLGDETIIRNEETESIEEDLVELIEDDEDIHYAEINTNTGAGIDELFEEVASQIIAEHNYFD